jgi:CPA2 family monovalent cation:H+ antiporter-2
LAERILFDISILLVVSILILFLCSRFKIPTIIGFFGAGVFSGPYGLALINDITEVNILSDVGIVLLLFTIGLEFSLDNISKFKKIFFAGGFSQIFVTFTVLFCTMKVLGNPAKVSIFFGLIVALSSTAIVFKLLQEKSLVGSPIGNIATAILIFQDIMVVPIMFIIPILSGGEAVSFSGVLLVFFKATATIAIIIILAKMIVPKFLYQVAKIRSRELFLLTIIGICLIIATATAKAGLSLPLGAFLAGVVISESEYSNFAVSNIMPFKDLFSSFFFISIGMLLNVDLFFHHIVNILIISLIIVFIKIISTFLVIYALKYTLRVAMAVSFGISQVGEFSFILAKLGFDGGIVSESIYQYFIASSILTMAATPFLFNVADKISSYFQSKFKALNIHKDMMTKEVEGIRNHIVVIGYGLSGKFIVNSAKVMRVPYIIIEMNPETVRRELKRGLPIIYGDASSIETLEAAKIKDARVVVIAISDIVAVRNATKTIRQINKFIYIIARTPYVSEVSFLKEAGANEVIPAEFETSIEMVVRVLSKFLIPRNDIEKYIEQLRGDSYKMLRNLAGSKVGINGLTIKLPNIDIISVRIPENWYFINKSIGEVNFRNRFGLTILAILRGENTILNPGANEILFRNDILVLIGPKEKVSKVLHQF